MKPLKVALAVLAVLLAAFFGVGLLLPDTAHVERSLVIDAPACNVYALVNSYQRFNDWSPWAKLDPKATYTYTGPEEGPGAKVAWTSDNPQVGTGSQEIINARPCEQVDQKLEFAGQGEATSTYRIVAEGGKVRVTWSFDATFGGDLVGRYFGLVMDGMVGPDFEQGLLDLQRLVAALPPADITGLLVERLTLDPLPFAYVTTTCPRTEVGHALGTAYDQVQQYATAHDLKLTGAPLAIYTGATEATYTIDAGVRLVAAPPTPAPDPDVHIGSSPAGLMLKVVHRGSYALLGQTHDRAAAWLAIHGLESGGSEWEEYISDPAKTPEDQLLTNVYYPIR